MEHHNLTAQELEQITQQMLSCACAFTPMEMSFAAALLSMQTNVPAPIRSVLMRDLVLRSGLREVTPALEAAMQLYVLCQRGEADFDNPAVARQVAMLSALRQIPHMSAACRYMTHLSEKIAAVLATH